MASLACWARLGIFQKKSFFYFQTLHFKHFKERDKLKAEIKEVTKERNQIRNELTAAFF
jgi:hypothetical protein